MLKCLCILKTKRKKIAQKSRHLLVLSVVLALSSASLAGALHVFQTAETYTPSATPTATATGTSTVATSGGGTSAAPTTPSDTPAPATAAPAPVVTPPKTTTQVTPTPVAPTPVPVVTPPSTPTAPAKPATEIATESECPGQADVTKTTTVLVCLTTHARAYNNLAATASESRLMDSAAAKAQDITTCGFSHTACGRDFGYWITTKGYPAGCYAENIAEGQRTPGEVFTAWMNSPGHKANILGATYKDIGVAYLANGTSPVWVMHLGGC